MSDHDTVTPITATGHLNIRGGKTTYKKDPNQLYEEPVQVDVRQSSFGFAASSMQEMVGVTTSHLRIIPIKEAVVILFDQDMERRNTQTTVVESKEVAEMLGNAYARAYNSGIQEPDIRRIIELNDMVANSVVDGKFTPDGVEHIRTLSTRIARDASAVAKALQQPPATPVEKELSGLDALEKKVSHLMARISGDKEPPPPVVPELPISESTIAEAYLRVIYGSNPTTAQMLQLNGNDLLTKHNMELFSSPTIQIGQLTADSTPTLPALLTSKGK